MARDQSADSAVFKMGTVGTVYSGDGVTVTFDGESSASTKRSMINTSGGITAGARVLCVRVGGTWVVLCKVGAPT